MASSACGAPTSTRNNPPLSEFLVVAVGKIGRGPESELVARYRERMRPRLGMVEIPEARGSAVEKKRREAAALLAALPAAAFVIALDLGGKTPDSERFAALVSQWLETGRPVAFVIGGAEGLDASVIARANYVLSLGNFTWPHLLVRAMLAEQLFRARAIAAGHPYHRAGRPW